MGAVKKEIKFSIDKQKALKIAKKAATLKFGMVKDEGFTFKVGTPSVPPMIAVVEVSDGVIFISGKGFGSTIANTIFGEISNAIEEAQENSNSNSSASNASQQSSSALSAEEQLKIVEALKGYKDLLDSGIITQEEFDAKKKELLGAKSQQAETTLSSVKNNQEVAIEQESQKIVSLPTEEPASNCNNGESDNPTSQQIIQPVENSKSNKTFRLILMITQWISFLFSLTALVLFFVFILTCDDKDITTYLINYRFFKFGSGFFYIAGLLLCLCYGIMLLLNNFRKTFKEQKKGLKIFTKVIRAVICFLYLGLISGFGVQIIFFGLEYYPLGLVRFSMPIYIVNDVLLVIPFLLMFYRHMKKGN